jgi:50S ribosomal protein L16 3-hydroxylase
VRGALPVFSGLIARQALFRLAGQEDAESRLVRRQGGKWLLDHGPFSRRDFASLPARNWTLLLQGLNLLLPEADALLRRFAFIPYARLDDVMLSYAAPGGGVGPHVDSYDVFLLQGEGRRRWRISRQRDLALDAHAPLKILKSFRATHEWVLEPGDMLYLPPGVAHEGVALSTCTTYSIGFRAPAAQEMALGFLDFLQDGVALKGRYADPGLAPARHPGEIPAAMIGDAQRRLARIRWGRREVERFLGEFLSQPKAVVQFDRPARPLPPRRFAAQLLKSGVQLDRRSLLLYHGTVFHINGETVQVGRAVRPLLARLADARSLPAGTAPPGELADLFYTWYRLGYLSLSGPTRSSVL